jgi:hypothetical protein
MDTQDETTTTEQNPEEIRRRNKSEYGKRWREANKERKRNTAMSKKKSTWGPGFQKIVDELKAKGHDTNAPKYEIEYLKDDIKWLTKINKKLVKILEEIVENAGVSLIYRNKAIKAIKEAKGELQ